MRIDFKLYDESGFWWLAPGHLGGHTLDDFINLLLDDKLEELLARHAVLPILMYGDGGGMLMRCVLGELTPAEQDNWTARTTATLDLTDGQLLLGTSCDPDAYADHPAPCALQDVAQGTIPAQAYADFGYINVPPGLYRVDVYCLPPTDMSATWERLVEPDSWAGTHPEAEPLLDYFQRTRPDEAMPPWIEYELYCQGVLADDRYDVPPTEPLLEFLIHLSPIATPLPQTHLTGTKETVWETRKPRRCPVGIMGNFP